jgi:stage II sporulation protein D
MQKIKKWGWIVSLATAIGVTASLTPLVSQAAYTPSVTTIRVGLYYDANALPSANLQNAGGLGSGFEFGYYDGNRNFVSIGAWTDEIAISMAMDRNMSWHPGTGNSTGEYREGTDGSVVLGCFHICMDTSYETFEEARIAAEPYLESYVKYDSGRFYVMSSQYTTRADAENAIITRGLTNCYIESGTSNTIAVVRTGTNRMIFEFDYGGTRHLGVRPMSINGEKTETWFRGYRYCG